MTVIERNAGLPVKSVGSQKPLKPITLRYVLFIPQPLHGIQSWAVLNKLFSLLQSIVHVDRSMALKMPLARMDFISKIWEEHLPLTPAKQRVATFLWMKQCR